jgi:signal transduction histidine kinase
MVERSSALSLELLREISQRLREFNQRYIEEMLQAERLAVVGRFARSIVHDLKNPLNIIGITSELASMPAASAEMRHKASGTIARQVERINELVGEILDFTQGTGSRVMLSTLDYGEFLAPLLDELRVEVELRGSRLEAAALPAVRVPLDPKRLRRIFHNLLRNATDAMPDGGTVKVQFEVNAGEVITTIEDTGRGIAPEIAEKLFEAFATFGKAHGTGLGLSICRKIAEDHGGRIWAENQPGKGALFAFALPLAPAAT